MPQTDIKITVNISNLLESAAGPRSAAPGSAGAIVVGGAAAQRGRPAALQLGAEPREHGQCEHYPAAQDAEENEAQQPLHRWIIGARP